MIYTFDLSRDDDVVDVAVIVHAVSMERAIAALLSQTRGGGLVARCEPLGTEDGVVEVRLSAVGYDPFRAISSDLIVDATVCACHPEAE